MNIVYAMTHHVYKWALPSMRSLAEHNPEARVFILAEDDQLPFELPMPAEIINVSGQTYFPETGVNYRNQYTYINLLKVRYPSLLPVQRVIHLDIDTIICDDLTEIWETDLTDKWVGAVPEYAGAYHPFGNMYYNMGVAVINLGQMRADNIEGRMQEYLNKVPQPFADQDAWNKYGLAEDKFTQLNVRWNEGICTGMTDNPGIVHYVCFQDWWTNRQMQRVEYLDRYKAQQDDGGKNEKADQSG